MNSPYSTISNREKQVLDLIIDENTSKEIAHRLFISIETVQSHRRNIMQKLDARNTAGMVRKAFECGLVRVANN